MSSLHADTNFLASLTTSLMIKPHKYHMLTAINQISIISKGVNKGKFLATRHSEGTKRIDDK